MFHRRQLDVHRLQLARDAIDHAVAILLHMHSHARQFAPLPHPFGRDKTAPEQSVLHVLSDAARIDAICLAPLQGPHRGRVDQSQAQGASFENVPDRNPVDPSRFHRHLFHSALFEPFAQTSQILREGREHGFFHLHLRTAGNTSANAYRHRVLVHVQTGATAIK
jgi:hypothetical protein